MSFFFERVCQVAEGVRKVRLQFDGTSVCVNSQIDKTLFVVDARQITMDDGIVGRQIQCSQICGHSSAKIFTN